MIAHLCSTWVRPTMLGLLCLLASACNTIVTPPPASQIYTLRPLAVDQIKLPRQAVNLVVARPSASPGLQQELIPLLRPNHQLGYYARARWAAPIPELLRFYLIDSVQNQDLVQSVTGDTRFAADNYRLDVHIQDFQAEYEPENAAPTVTVKLAYTLTHIVRRQAVTSFVEHVTIAAESNRLSAVVGAFQRATEQATTNAITRIGAALARQPEGT